MQQLRDTRPAPVTTARWLRRFYNDLQQAGFTDEIAALLLPTVLQHLLASEDLLTENED